MTPQAQSMSDLNRNAIRLLIRELGVAPTLRFISQFSPGSGNYTEERHAWLDSLSIEDIKREMDELESRRKHSA